MKKILYSLVVCTLVFSACKKESSMSVADATNPVDYLTNVQQYLREELSASAYDSIDFQQYRISKQKARWYVRVAFKNKDMRTDFILLQTDSPGTASVGKIIHIEQQASSMDASGGGSQIQPNDYNGAIEIISLDGKLIIRSPITNGFIEAFHPKLFNRDARENSFPVPYDELPEVVVVAYRPAVSQGNGFYFASFMMLQNILAGETGGAGVYSDAITYSYGGNYYPDGNGYITGNNEPSTENLLPAELPDIAVEVEQSSMRPQIDMNAWMKCFTDIPDDGAVCSVTLLGDLPVDTDPSIGLNIWSGNTGHCFLQLTKTNGSQSVTQIIGFTAESPFQAIVNTDAFVRSKTVDNAGHKYNCAITMDLTSYGLNTVIDKMKSLSASMPYSVVNYDCLDYGLEVFNAVRPGDPLIIPKVYSTNDPFSNIATGPKLYTVLEEMIASGSPEAGNIIIDGPRHAGLSHGPCN